MSTLESGMAKMAVSVRDPTAALASVTNATNSLGDNWDEIKPVGYNYDVYNAKTKEERDEVARRTAPNQADNGEIIESHEDKNGQTFTEQVPNWGSSATKYEWKDEFGDVAPEYPELERQLFGSHFMNRVGNKFSHLTEMDVTLDSEEKVHPMSSFEHAGLHPVMLDNISKMGYTTPTPVQAYCIPAVLTNHDVIAIAQTGSGKTAAFLIPTLSKLMGKARKLAAFRPNVAERYDPRTDGVTAEPLIVVVVPTRELAVQIFDEARRLCYRSMLRPCVAYGGAPARDQADELRKGCDILIGTPGRMVDFLRREGLLSLRRVKYTIIDEADELVSSDWSEEMQTIMTGVDNNEDDDHRYMMFSATFPKEARALAREHLDLDHIRIRVGRIGSTHLDIQQIVMYVEESQKRQCLFDLLIAAPPARTIIFVNNKKSADFLDDYLFNKGLPSTSIHSDRNQREREDALRAFKTGKAPILVATGVSARGLDILNVMHVINYDLPNVDHGGINEYVHRIGRTARIGNDGIATSFYNDRNEDFGPYLVKILLECKQAIPDFLEQHMPAEGENLDFEDDSDVEGEGGDTGGWGAPAASASDAANAAVASGADDGWGAPEGAEVPGAKIEDDQEAKDEAPATSSQEEPSVEPDEMVW